MAANEISGALRARPAMEAMVSLIYTISPKAAAGVRSWSDQLFITLWSRFYRKW